MTYKTTKPDAGPSPFLDCPTIQGNFSSFGTTFSSTAAGVVYNHSAMNDRNQGDHQVIMMQAQNSDPNPDDSFAALYCKQTLAVSGVQPQLFTQIQQFLSHSNIPMQLTHNTVNIVGPSQYQSFLPYFTTGATLGVLLVYFGTTTNIAVPITVSPTPTTFLFAVATAYNMTIIGTPIPVQASTTILSSNSFQINSISPPAGYVFGWLAIGIA